MMGDDRLVPEFPKRFTFRADTWILLVRSRQLQYTILPFVLNDERHRCGPPTQPLFHDDTAFEDITRNRLCRITLALIIWSGQFVLDLK